jgi:dTDP-4-amino-4,6-dideoxygalactose transaminase
VGLAQLPALDRRVRQRRARFERYAAAFATLPGTRPMPEPVWATSSRWLSVFTFPDPVRIHAALARAGIESRPVWKPMHLQPVFHRAGRVGGQIAAALFRSGLCLPSGRLPPNGEQRVIDVVRAACR